MKQDASLERRQYIVKLYKMGVTKKQIQARLGVTQTTVNNALLMDKQGKLKSA